MTENDVKACLSELNNKRCEGFDRISVCMLYDAKSIQQPYPLEPPVTFIHLNMQRTK